MSSLPEIVISLLNVPIYAMVISEFRQSPVAVYVSIANKLPVVRETDAQSSLIKMSKLPEFVISLLYVRINGYIPLLVKIAYLLPVMYLLLLSCRWSDA